MSKKEYIVDSDENSDYMVNLIAKVIDEAGPRLPCSEGEKKGAEIFTKELEKYCDSVESETFEHYPLLGVSRWPRTCITLTLISVIVFFFYPLSPPLTNIIFSAIALAISFFSLMNVYFQYLQAEQWPAKLYRLKPKESRNVVGVIKPKGEIKKRIVYSGHIDSAHRFNLLQYTHEAYIYFIIIGLASLFNFPIMQGRELIVSILGVDAEVISIIFNWMAFMIPIGVSVGFLIVYIISSKFLSANGRKNIFWGALSQFTPRTFLLIVGIMTYQIVVTILMFNFVTIDPASWKTAILVILNYGPAMVAFFFFVNTKEGVPGALDNLSACVIAVCVAKIVSDWKTKSPERLPKNTEVIIALFGSEESGCDGSGAFAKKHISEYNKIDTTCINMDTIEDPKILRIFRRENSTRTDFTPEIYNLLVECAKEVNVNYVLEDQPWATGGSDASGLIKGGLKAGSIVNLEWENYLYYYHTDKDNMELINKERRPCNELGKFPNANTRCAFENCLKVCVRYLEKKDKE